MCNVKAVRVIISGFGGTMGRQLFQAACDPGMRELIHIVGGIERPDHPLIGSFKMPWGEGGSVLPLNENGGIPHALLPADVIIDFSKPAEASVITMWAAARNRIPVIICSTGHNQEQRESIEQYAKRIACVLAPNTSMGANIFFQQMEDAARIMKPEDWDVEIIEKHHRDKADAPSGTALEIARRIAKTWSMEPDEAIQYGWNGKTGTRPRGKIGITSSRGGTIVGIHTVTFAGKSERLEYTHEGESKMVFAHGAFRAARWIVEKERGLYGMENVLGLK